MEVVKENIDELNAVLKVEVGPEDLKDRVMSKLRQYAKQANIKGFRPGKVPVSVVKKMYGKGVLFEELNSALSEGIDGYIKENEIRLVGSPLPKESGELELDLDFKTGYSFEYEVGLAPDFEVSYDLQDLPPLYEVEIDDEFLGKELANIQERYGDMTNPDESAEGDILFGKVTEIRETEGEDDELMGKMIALNPKRIPSDDLKKEMVGKKPEDKFNVKMLDIFQDDAEVRKFWELEANGQKSRDVSDEELKEIIAKDWEFDVRKVNHIEPAEINQELFDKMFGEGNVESEEDFKEKVKEQNGGYLTQEATKYYNGKAIKAMLDANKLDLPDEFLKKYLVESNEKITADNVDEHYEKYAESMTWSLLIEKIQVADETVNVTNEDLEIRARFMAETQYMQFTQGGNEEMIQSIVQYQLQDKNTREKLFYDVLDQKITDHIRNKLSPPKESITATEFIEKMKAEN